jgi:hypothetical protein
LPANIAAGFVLALIVGGSIYFYSTFSTSSPTSNSVVVNGPSTILLSSTASELSSPSRSTATDTYSTTESKGSSTCPDGLKTTAINGVSYCTDDVTTYIVMQNPGYGYFPNRSISFMGVRFDTVCQPGYAGCPGNSNSKQTTTVLAAAIELTLTFPGNSYETIGDVIGASTQVIILSNHIDPKAGIIISRGNTGYNVFLLVQANPLMSS